MWTSMRMAASVLALACNLPVTEQRGVEVPGDASLGEKVALARRVGESLMRSGLPEKIRARFPGVADDQLGGLEILWTSAAGAEGFSIDCAITLPRARESTATLLEYCRELLESELERVQAEAGPRSPGRAVVASGDLAEPPR